ncbi:hypothetical protein ACFV80_29670 [Streptomyces sp. NPDC059862]
MALTAEPTTVLAGAVAVTGVMRMSMIPPQVSPTAKASSSL